ncbi:hypothetical protein MHU86_22513 [Fragilaria crotonensis]|nr:hypothetical protein MHU86_22513 [Fragilaria crotonensis]
MDEVVAPRIEEVIEVPPPNGDTMNLALTWIGFDNEATRNRIQVEGFGSFDDLKSMKEKDIRDLAESYGRRTAADGRFIFGIRRIRYLIVRMIEKDQSDTVSKAADPGKFKDEKKWPEWEPAFVNYLSTIPGVNGIPLSYVVREDETPPAGSEYGSFNERAIACAPLSGDVFQADARKVHQLIKSFLQTESAEQWIKPLARRQSGRDDMIALRKHYSGEGNTSRRIAAAERIRDTLHYKNERAMSFSSFLDKMQKMFNIFEEEKEVISEQAKVRMLLKKVEHPQLQDAVGALRVRASMDGLTFTECANHLSAQVSELSDHQSTRKISGAVSDRTKEPKRIRGGGASKQDSASKRKGIYMPDGSVWTGYYSDWAQMSSDDKQIVLDTRKKNKGKSPQERATGVRGRNKTARYQISDGGAETYYRIAQ